ncbi:MoxR family ATPase [Candidatus Sumerlaeota bacterium]|nr:MoxR family ATPase [Candidatus Sumerlaeota bacterium]
MNSPEFAHKLQTLTKNITSVIHGKDDVVELCLVALLARGHVLLEDVPGVGKTTLALTIANSIQSSFQRIQFTSDMLPSDILGVTIFDQTKKEFEFREGPIFANVVLADEINRTTPKTQSALLEAMNVGQVSMDRHVYPLPRPFIVLATQNPIEFHGTFPLPKSQMDRFLLRLHIGYPERSHEVQVLREQYMTSQESTVKAVLTAEEVIAMQELAMKIKVDDDLLDYIVRIAEATRRSTQFEIGVSTRGAIALRRCAQALAAVRGRDFVTPDDIKALAAPVLAHRVQVARTFETSGFGHHEDEAAIRAVLNEVAVPI